MAKKEDEKKLDDFKIEYGKLQSKYSLPGYKEMNEDFNIERISDIETEYVLREIRKFIADRFSNYMRFVEAILNPSNAPMFVFSVIKLLGKEDKKLLDETYKMFVKIEVQLIELDISYNEENEARFIIQSYKDWQKIKESVLKIISTIKKNWENKTENNNKGYFG